LIIGLQDNGDKVSGLEEWDLNDKRAKVQDAINSVEGILETSIEAVDGLIVVDVEANKDSVNKAPSDYFMRQDTIDQSMEHDQIRALMEESGDISFEQVQCRRFHFPSDIDREAIDRFLERSNISEEKVDIDSMLMYLGTAHREDGIISVNNAGAVLFGDHPERFVPNSGIQCVAYESEGESIEWIDKKELNSPAVLAVFEAIDFIHKNTTSKQRVKDTDRETVNQYPTNALREALVNAVVHRDYHNQREKTQVKVYPNRIEIRNPGGLIGNMSIDDLWTDSSIQRNPTIASVMQRMELAEEMGTGIQRITEEMTKRNYPEPDFKDNGKFVVNLIGKEIPQDLNERQKKFLRETKFSGIYTNSDYQDLMEVSRNTAWSDLKELTERDIMDKKGQKRGTKYEFI
jgi:ATP-dependent DNA helicase RecG